MAYMVTVEKLGERFKEYYNPDFNEAIRNARYESRCYPDREVIVENTQNGAIVWKASDPPELKEYNTYSYDEWNSIEHIEFGHLEKRNSPSVYFDIDGTLGKWYADGRGLPYEEIINPQNHYFRDIEPHVMMILLAQKLQEDGVDVCIISAADKNTIRDKWEWIDEHLPFIPKGNICFSPIGADKSEFVKGNAEISILIDDYNKNLEEWKGTSIKAINTVNSHQHTVAEIDFTLQEAALKRNPALNVKSSVDIVAEGIERAVDDIKKAGSRQLCRPLPNHSVKKETVER